MTRKILFLSISLSLNCTISLAAIDSQEVSEIEKKVLGMEKTSTISGKNGSSVDKIRELERKRMAEHREFFLSRLGQNIRGE